MSDNDGLELIAPRFVPPLDASFRPAVLASRAFRRSAETSGGQAQARLALEQADGNVSRFTTPIFAESDPRARGNFRYLERITKLLLWTRGGHRLYFDGPAALAARL